MWMLLVLFYGLCKGGREIVKKKAMVKSTVMEVLLFYTLVAFVMVTPEITGTDMQVHLRQQRTVIMADCHILK